MGPTTGAVLLGLGRAPLRTHMRPRRATAVCCQGRFPWSSIFVLIDVNRMMPVSMSLACTDYKVHGRMLDGNGHGQ